MRAAILSTTMMAMLAFAAPASSQSFADAFPVEEPQPDEALPTQPATPANPQIDYPGFERLVDEVAQVRRGRRMAWPMFNRASGSTGAILLDTRSAADFARGHLRGAVNLPFSEFTDAKLAEVLGEDTARPVYIYCNNNFADNRAPVVTKRAPLALNIPTFINLHGYGYTNVWELADVVSIDEIGADWVSPAIGLAAAEQ